MKNILLFLLFLLPLTTVGQFTYSGYIRNADGSGAINVPVFLYRRTVPNIQGFTQQTNWNGHSYYRSTSPMTWTNAKIACENMGGHLVTITSAAENNFVFSTWPSGWIGFTDETVEGQWRWVTGEAVTYTNWNFGEPNNSNNEDYAQFVNGGKWNDLPNISLPYVLEFEYIVTTTEWELHKIVYTNSIGYYSFSEQYDPSKEYYIQINSKNPSSDIQFSDMKDVIDLILEKRNKRSIDWHMYDINNDGKITISDVYSLNKKRVGFNDFQLTPKLYTQTQHSALQIGTINQKNTIIGVNEIRISSPVNGTTNSNYYLIAPGYKSQVIY
jgi:hypothetical protein